MIHPDARVESTTIGSNTRVWQFTVILAGARLGDDCNICANCFIENDVIIGDRVTVKSGVQLWDGVRIEDDVFIGPNATFTNDKNPRTGNRPEKFAVTIVKKKAVIGANATILPGLTVGENAFVGAGSVVTRDVPPLAVVVGNPARITGYMDTLPMDDDFPATDVTAGPQLNISGAKVYPLTHVPDLRGDLCAAEFEHQLPFKPERIFFVSNVPNARVRGAHAHKQCHQFLICLKGGVSIMLDDGSCRQEVRLEKNSLGLYMAPGVWAVQYKYTSDAILLVLASHPYDAGDYIRDYGEFKKWKNAYRPVS